jgi:hypothetical protein
MIKKQFMETDNLYSTIKEITLISMNLGSSQALRKEGMA